MKTSSRATKFLAISAIALTLSMNNFTIAKAASKPAPKTSGEYSVAVVDVQKIVESSPTINAINVERKNKLDDLVKFVEKAKTDVEKETNAAKKKALEEKYNKELNDRKGSIDTTYAKKLSDVDKDVTAIIKAKAVNYNLVLQKSSVLNGGVDITSEVIKELK